jgi:hypothetical protein
MGKVSYSWLVALSGLAVFFGLSGVALSSASDDPLPATIRDLKVSDVFVPPEAGTISKILRAPPSASHATPLLILIQDAHTNYEAQTHIAAILESLAKQYGLRLILVEGGFGDVSLAYLKPLGPKAILEELAQDYLQRGLISGEEFFELVSDYPLVLWGVDDPTLYEQHYQRFVELETSRALALAQVDQLREVLEQLEAQILNPALVELAARREALASHEEELSEHLDYLSGQAAHVGVSLDQTPQAAAFLQARELEQTLNLDQVNHQQRQLVGQLRQRLSAQALARLTELAQQLQAHAIEPAAYYHELVAAAASANLELAQFPQLADYVRYLQRKAQLQPEAVWKEIILLHQLIRAQLAQSADERQVLELGDSVRLLARLLALDWLPEDYQRYQADSTALELDQWAPVLKELAVRQGMPWPQSVDVPWLGRLAEQALGFYEMAHQRDTKMVEQALAKIQDQTAPVAAFIVGGFHTDSLAARLVERGLSVAVITPWVGQGNEEDEDRRYAEILMSKHGSQQGGASR